MLTSKEKRAKVLTLFRETGFEHSMLSIAIKALCPEEMPKPRGVEASLLTNQLIRGGIARSNYVNAIKGRGLPYSVTDSATRQAGETQFPKEKLIPAYEQLVAHCSYMAKQDVIEPAIYVGAAALFSGRITALQEG